ncbi:hypothetical protein CU097_011449 [Rhizopus azygosporus]|uniref:Epidermal growth factor receptor substrate 15 n=2 Tax=Rhizopus TaxID=4842 RepID=A0A367K2I5_RHIAZ|nr:EF-hand [Rhizopus microsporus]RCH96424.1 hypothetical protein CU097_011449 [Rhizopus azygosporus]
MSWESLLTPQETRLYSHLFQTVSKTQEGIVTGAEAVRFFATSGVPTEILSEIWEAADRDKVGYLTPETFAIALKLIACAQHGKEAVEPVLATRVPLPQFDGVVAPSPMIANNSALDIPITAAEREKYASIFRVHQPVNGIMDAETARNVFLKSKLPVDTLSQIWNLADVRQSGTLNEAEFIIAMHYIAKLMDGTLKALPDKLPPAVFQSATGSAAQSPLVRNMASPAITRQASIMTPPQRARTIDSLGSLAFGAPPATGSIDLDWDVTPQERQQFNVYFDKIDSAHSGYIQGKEAVEFFKNSRLPESELAHIWDLSDTQQRGSLSRDEFAVAMHLIHKRLRGGVLPQTLPRSLIPPSQRQQNNVFASPAFVAASPAPVASVLDTNNDLLGDFGNDQVATETNQVNLLQNQITSMSSQTASLKNQKISTENALEQLTQQRKHLEAQMVDVKAEHENVVKELNELQEQVRREEAEWDRVRSEYNAAQQQLVAVQNETAQVNQTLENGRAETESLKRRIFEIQEETKRVNAELDKLRAQSKQQGMMLDINRRQVTAAEQDRALAERNLQDYKVAAGLTNEIEDSSDDESVEEQKEPLPQPTPSAVSTPALDNLFGSPSVQTSDKHVTSPFDEFAESITKGNTFENPQNNVSASQDDFDAIFGTMSISTPAADTPAHAFDPTQWPTSPTSVTTKSSRGPPPPPPPQSRHHRQTSISSIASSTVGAKKQRAPPPPPPAIAPSSSSTALEKIADAKEEQNDEDDFEAAFSGKLPEAKIVTKDDQFADFDDAFSVFETNKSAHNVKPAVVSPNDDWTAAFEPFKSEQKKPEEPKVNDDWDSIFGVSSAPANNTASVTQHVTGFDDSFSNFADDFGKQKAPKSPPAAQTTTPVGDKVQDLIKMGFGEKEAKDALNRYDQDLEKASNFLLDQTSK